LVIEASVFPSEASTVREQLCIQFDTEDFLLGRLNKDEIA